MSDTATVETGRALMRLHRAVQEAVQQNLIGEDESLTAARERLSQTYAFIGAPVGINAQHLIPIMDALLDPALSGSIDPAVVGAVASRPMPTYGPAPRELG